MHILQEDQNKERILEVRDKMKKVTAEKSLKIMTDKFSQFFKNSQIFRSCFLYRKTDDHSFYRGFGRSNLRQTNENHRQPFYAL